MLKRLFQQFKRPSFVSKLGIWGSLASIVSVVIGVIALFGPSAAIAPLFLFGVLLPLSAIFCVSLWLSFRQKRLETLVKGLKGVPAHVRGDLLRLEFNSVVPKEVTPDQWRLINRERSIFRVVELGMLLLFVVAVWFLLRALNDSALNDLRRQLDAVTAQLADAAEKDKRRLIITAEAHGYAAALELIQPSELTRQLKDKTQQLLSEFKSAAGPTALSEDDARRVKLAQAQIAYIEGRYRDVLSTITASDIQKQRELTEKALAQEFNLVHVRADSLYALGQWIDALATYSRLCELRPTSVTARDRMGACLYNLGRLHEAADTYDYIVANLLPQFQHGTVHGEVMASALANYAGVLAELGNLDDAFAMTSASLDMYDNLRLRGDSQQLQLERVMVLKRRAGIWADTGQVENAMKDYQRARDGAEALHDKSLYLQVLCDEATVLVENGQGREALPMLNQLIEQFAKSETSDDQTDPTAAETHTQLLMTRAIALMSAGDAKTALADCDAAIGRLKSSKEPSGPAADADMSNALNHRAHARIALNQIGLALEDLQRALAIAMKAGAKERSPELITIVCQSAITYGDIAMRVASEKSGEREKTMATADEYFSFAINMLHRVLDTAPRVSIGGALADALRSRAVLRYKAGRKREAKDDIEEARTLLEKIVKNGNPVHLARSLAECKINSGILASDDGDEKKAIQLVDNALGDFRIMRTDTRLDVSTAMDVRGAIHAKSNKRTEAIQDYANAIQLLNVLVTQEGRSDLRPYLEHAQRQRERLDSNKPLETPQLKGR